MSGELGTNFNEIRTVSFFVTIDLYSLTGEIIMERVAQTQGCSCPKAEKLRTGFILYVLQKNKYSYVFTTKTQNNYSVIQIADFPL